MQVKGIVDLSTVDDGWLELTYPQDVLSVTTATVAVSRGSLVDMFSELTDDDMSEGEHLNLTETVLVIRYGLTEDQAIEFTASQLAAGWVCPRLAIQEDGTTVYDRPRALHRTN